MRLRLPDALWPSSLDARPLASTAAGNAALAVCGLLTGMLAARLLGAEGRGQLAAALAWPQFLATLGSFGLPEAVAYLVARSPVKARAALSTALVLALPFTAAAVIAGIWLLPRAMRGQTTDVVRVAIPCLVLVPLLTLSAAPSQALRGVGRFQAWNVLRLVTPLAWLAALVAVQGTLYANVPTLAAAFIGATALSALASQGYAWRALGGRAAPERGLMRPILAYGAPTMAATIPTWLNQKLDQLVMVALLDARSLGLYVVAVAWSTAAHPLALVVAHNAVPALAGAKDGWQRTRSMYRAGAVAAIVTTALLVAATPVLLPLIFGKEFRAAVPVAIVMALAGGVQAVNLVGAECLRGLGRPRAVLLAECVGLGIMVFALPVLVLLSGIVGAASASLLSYTAVLLAQQRLMRTPRTEPSVKLTAPMPPELDPVA